MNSIKDERKLLRYTYLLCIVCFTNLAFNTTPIDKGAFIMAGITCVLIGYSYFIIRRFFSDGDKYIFILASILSVIGIVMLYRINMATSVRQIIWFVVGVAGYILIVVLLPDLKSFVKYKYLYLAGTIIFTGIATIIGKDLGGNKNWVSVAGFLFQPSEFGKLLFVAYFASALKEYKHFKDLILPVAVAIMSVGFMVLQKDLGSALIFFVITITMVYIATSNAGYVAVGLGLLSVGAVVSYKLFDHVRIRVAIWQNPWKYATGNGWQILQSLFAIGEGGWKGINTVIPLIGTGLNLGHPSYVPVRESDFIFAAICEEMGFLIGFGMLILFFLLFYRCMRAAVYAESKFSRLVAVGYSSMIAAQVLVIVGGNLNAIPLTGITLPLVSYGGSSMLITFFSLGIVQKISEEGR